MTDKLFQVKFPTQTLQYRTYDPNVDLNTARQVLLDNVKAFVESNIEEIDLEANPQAVVSQQAEESN